MACAVALGATAATGSTALAQRSPEVEDAMAAYREGRLDQALARFQQALETGNQDPDMVVEIHLHIGIVRAAQGEQREAEAAFEAALALRPELDAPEELSPVHRQAFDRAQAARAGRRLRIQATPPAQVSRLGDTAVRIAVEDAPAAVAINLVAVVESGDGGPALRRILGPGPATLTVPSDAWGTSRRLSVTIDAEDRHGNVLISATLALRDGAGAGAAADDGAGIGGPITGGAVDGEDDGLPWLWIGIGALVAAGALTGVLLATAEDRYVVGAPMVP